MTKKAVYSHEARNHSGIYAIVNLLNGHMYIGKTSLAFSERWGMHRRALERNTHDNYLLQDAWNEFGADAFEFRIVECVRRYETNFDYIAAEMKHIANAVVPLYNLFM